MLVLRCCSVKVVRERKEGARDQVSSSEGGFKEQDGSFQASGLPSGMHLREGTATSYGAVKEHHATSDFQQILT